MLNLTIAPDSYSTSILRFVLDLHSAIGIGMLATLCGANDWEVIAYSQEKADWPSRFNHRYSKVYPSTSARSELSPALPPTTPYP
jgi:soluble lytic murein transglycosylase-like protein